MIPIVIHEIARIAPVSLAKWYSIVTVLIVAVTALPALLLELAAPGSGIVTYVMVVAVAALGAFFVGLLTGFLYNGLASLIGGIKVDLAGGDGGATNTRQRADHSLETR